MYWLYLVIIANLISAFVVLIDKYLVGPKAIGHSEVYAFYIGVLSAVVLAMLPFGAVVSPTFIIALISLIVGISYMTSIICLYKSLQTSDASDVAPVAGATSAIATFALSYFFLGANFTASFSPFAFSLLVVGTLLMSYFRFNKSSIAWILTAGLLFGYSSVFIKILFGMTTFGNAFFWSRMANVVGALMLLLIPRNREIILAKTKAVTSGTSSLILVNKALAGVAALLIFLSIKMSSVYIVNALGGLQFVFLFALAYFFPKHMPRHFETFHEHRDYENAVTYPRSYFFYKTVATVLIIYGFFLIFI